MKIGIYKPCKKVYFYENVEDHAGWSFEVVNFAKIFADRGHDVYILSDTDLVDNELPHIYHKDLSLDDDYDYIFMFCGVFNIFDISVSHDITTRAENVCYIYTDYNLTPNDISLYDCCYTQSKRYGTYAALEQLVVYHANIVNDNYKKDIQFYFGGTERDRLDDYLEYIWRPGHLIHGKSKFLDFNNYIPYSEHVETMRRTKYSIVIADVTYNQFGWVTPRYYENILNNIICFVDHKYDKDNLLSLPATDFRRVSNYKELREKIKILEENPQMYKEILCRQQKEITPAMLSGENIYQKIMK